MSTQLQNQQLQGVCLIEKDSNNEVLWVWSYPGVDGGMRDLLMKKCNLDQLSEEEGKDVDVLSYAFGHFFQVWYYLLNFTVPESTQFSKVTSFSIIILAKDFNPEKYHHMADIFGQAYLSSGSPVSIVTHYLSAYTKGSISNPPGALEPLAISNYDIRKAYIACPFKDVASVFGIESILIYNALLLKKRVAVYASSLDTVLKFSRTLPLFVWHRKNWDIVYPQLELEDSELSTLTSHGTYVAGFTDPAIEGRTDLYDLFFRLVHYLLHLMQKVVKMAAWEVVPTSVGRSLITEPKESNLQYGLSCFDWPDAFSMTKLHRDIAVRLLECVQDEEFTDQATIKELSVKTKELINNIKTLIPEGEKLSLEMLHARKLTPATENFLYSLASVEGLAQL